MVDLMALEKSIPWVFNANCICLVTNFIAIIGLIALTIYLFNFVRKNPFIEAKLFFAGIVFLLISEIFAFSHGSLSFGTQTGLAWNESLSIATGIFGLISALIFGVFVYKLGGMVRKI